MTAPNWHAEPRAHRDALLLDARRELYPLSDSELLAYGQRARRSLDDDLPDWLREWQSARVEAARIEWRRRDRSSERIRVDVDLRGWIDRAKARTDLAELIALPLPSKPMGSGKWLCVCPFHADREPSLSVDTEKGLYHCFGCDVSGDVLTWLQLAEGLDFGAALRRLSELSGLALPDPPKRHRVNVPPRAFAP